MDLNTIGNVRAWTGGVEVEDEAIAQIGNIARLPIVAGHVAIMPDVHLGKGATVGSVIPTRAAIIPAAVGVDIGCGMCAVRTELAAGDLPDSLAAIRSAIEALVPVGFSMHNQPVTARSAGLFGAQLERNSEQLHTRYRRLRIMNRIGKFDHARVWTQLGTLGGGNHFVEICLDQTDRVWIMLHSGSRNVGKTIGETAIGMARAEAQRLQRNLPDRDLAWLDQGTPQFEEYVDALRWAQDYAAHNRSLMLHAVLTALHAAFGRAIGTAEHAVNCHHN